MSLIAISKKNVAEEKKLQKMSYQPTEEEMGVLSRVNRDYIDALNLRSSSWREFNDVSVIDRQSADQMAFNAYVAPKAGTSDEDWKANTVRPVTRNKVIAIAAKVTSTLISPHVFAQNEKDEEDRLSGRVMEDMMQWSNDMAGYEDNFLKSVIGMLVNPAACVYTGYQDVKRKIKDIKPDGSWAWKEVIDEDYSGFQDRVVPIDEIFLGNMYIQDIQRQPYVIRMRTIDFEVAKRKYGHLDNFKYVKPGMQAVTVQDETGFYQDQDDTLSSRLVYEFYYYNKNEDLELTYLGIVPMTDIDAPLKRKDKKYPFIWGGYEWVDEGQFAYYKSLVFKLANEQAVVDEMYNMVLDGTFLALMPPTAVFGEDMIDTNIVAPGNVVTFEDPNTKMETFAPRSDVNAGYQAMQSVEQSMAEGSQSSQSAGVGTPGEQTAFETATLEQNARTQLGLFGKMIAKFVKDWGELRMGDIIQHMTVATATEVSGEGALTFRNMLLKKDGEEQSTKIEFTPEVPEEAVSEEDAVIADLKRLERAVKNKQTIFQVNPKLFRELKFSVRVSPDVLFQPSGSIQRALNLQLYDRAVQHPLANQERVFKELLIDQFKPGEADKFVAQQQPQQQQQAPGGVSGEGGAAAGAEAGVVDALTPEIAPDAPKQPNRQAVSP